MVPSRSSPKKFYPLSLTLRGTADEQSLQETAGQGTRAGRSRLQEGLQWRPARSGAGRGQEEAAKSLSKKKGEQRVPMGAETMTVRVTTSISATTRQL